MKKECKKASLLGMIILLWANNLFAQGPDTLWTKIYEGDSSDIGYSVQQTSDGGYIITGGTGSFGAGKDDVYLIKTDAKGNTFWTRTYGGDAIDIGYSVQQTSDGGYIITGGTGSFGAGKDDVYLIKTDASGDTLWTGMYGGINNDYSFSVQQTLDGGYIIAGHTTSFGAGASDVYLIKTDTLGDTLWTKTYGGTEWDAGSSVQQTSDGGYIITGWTASLGAGACDVYLLKTDVNGDTLWTKTYGGTEYDAGSSVQQTSNGGYIITGWTWSFSAGKSDVYLLKTDVNGDTLWTKTYGGIGYDGGNSVRQTLDEGYIITGWTWSFGAGERDVYLIKTDAFGDTLWTKTYGGPGWDEGYSIQQTSDGGYIIVGWTESFDTGARDIWIIKTEP